MKITFGKRQAEAVFMLVAFGLEVSKFIGVFATLRHKFETVTLWGYFAVLMATVVPYVRSWFRLIPALRRQRYEEATRWGLLLAAAFLTPYLYLAAVIQDVSGELFVGIAVFVLCSAILSLRRLIRTVRTSEKGEKHETVHQPAPRLPLGS